MECDTREVLYGGAAGGGKSEALLMAALQFVEVPKYSAILFRNTYADLSLPGALIDRAAEVLAGTAARWNGQEHVWSFPSGASLAFGYMNEQNSRLRYQSTEFQYVGFDELTQFKERDYRYMFSRLRRLAGSQVPIRMRAGSNPGGPGHPWVKKRFDPQHRHNETQGRKFISALVEDNPYLDISEYELTLQELDSQTRKQLRTGDWTDFGGEHYRPSVWPRYMDTGDAYRIRVGDQFQHYRKSECSRMIALDWAMGKPKKNATPQEIDGRVSLTGDCTAFVAADLTVDGQLFLIDCLNERIPMGSNAPRLAEVCRRWRPVIVAGDDDNLSETMLLETRRHRDIPTVRTMSIGGKNKLVRSQASIVRAERNMVYLPHDEYRKGNEWVETLSDQLASFTGADGEPDDIADCVSILGRMADEFKPGEAVTDLDYPAQGTAGYDGGGMGGYDSAMYGAGGNGMANTGGGW